MEVRQATSQSLAAGEAGGPRVLARIPDLNSPHNAALLSPPPADAATAKSSSVAENLLAPLAAQGARLVAPLGKLIETIGQGAKLDPQQLVVQTANSWWNKVRGLRVQPRSAMSALVAAIVVLGIVLATRNRGQDTPPVDTASPGQPTAPIDGLAGTPQPGGSVAPTVAPKSPQTASVAPLASPSGAAQTPAVVDVPTLGSPRLARIPGLSGDTIHDGRTSTSPGAAPHGAATPTMPEKFPNAALPDPRRAENRAAEQEIPPVARLRGVIVK